MIKINDKSTITTLFSFFTGKKIEYVWLHGFNNNDISDIDIAVSEEVFFQIEDTVSEFCAINNFKLLQIIQHEFCAKYFVLGRINNKNIEYLIPDICSHYVRNGRILLRANELLNNSKLNGSFYQCSELIESEYLFLKRTLKKSWNKSHFDDYKNIYSRNYCNLSKCLDKYLGRRLKIEFIKSIEENNLNNLNSTVAKLRRSILLKSFLSNPLQYLFYKALNLNRIVKRIFNPTGLFIIVIGTDGSGKSTIINKIITDLAPIYRRTALFHWKPTFFNNNKSENVVVKEPHKQEPRSTLISSIKLLLYFLQYLLGYVFKIVPMKIRSTLIIFDRYYYDILVDQRRFRIKLPKKIISFLGNFVPKPYLIFFLDTDAELAFKRKSEITIEELKRQRKEFLKIKTILGDKFYSIKNNAGVDDAVKNIISMLFHNLEIRSRK